MNKKIIKSPADISITILINNYNYGRFLGKAIESAFAQTWPHVQIILVDDGSTDNSAEIARRYRAPNYLFLHKENGGQNSAIALGLLRATGDYTIMLDSDDWLLPNACERIAGATRNRPNAVLYRLQKLDQEGRERGTFPNIPFIERDYRNYIKVHGYIPSSPTSGNAYETEFLKQAFKFVQADLFCSDGYLAWAAGWTENIVVLQYILGNYLIHGTNASTSAGNDSARLLKTNGFALGHCKSLQAWLTSRNEQFASWHDLIGAYNWRNITYFKIVSGTYSEFNWVECRNNGITKFIRARHIGIWKQTKNVLFIFFGSYFGQLRDALKPLK